MKETEDLSKLSVDEILLRMFRMSVKWNQDSKGDTEAHAEYAVYDSALRKAVIREASVGTLELIAPDSVSITANVTAPAPLDAAGVRKAILAVVPPGFYDIIPKDSR